jgi:hypothetical protein
LADRLQFNFSQTFPGAIWSTLVVPQQNLLILEVRDEDKREVRFSAFDYLQNSFRWKDLLLEEPWWIGLTAVSENILLLHLYQNTENPDEKSLMAFDILKQKVLWHLKDFAFSYLEGNAVVGMQSKPEILARTLDLRTGEVIPDSHNKNPLSGNISAIKPFQYVEGHAYFDTVKSFLAIKLNIEPVSSVEYVEYNSLIFISYYVKEEGLVNYLVVFDETGTLVAKEKLGDQLKGIGFETFFILAGCLIFVRNRGELVSYRIV